MSGLDKLIKKLCPDGVIYKKYSDIGKCSKGSQLNKERLMEDGLYPVINGGINPSGYWNDYNFDSNTITISQGGASAGYVKWQTSRFWAGAHCYVLIDVDKMLNYRFLYHVIKFYEKRLTECQYGAGIPALATKTVNDLDIPIPPIEIQNEIVRILDSFTELTEELTEELTARKRQYEYYRDYLIENNENYTKLEQILKIKNGKDYKGLNPGNVPVYGTGGIMTYVSEYMYNKPTVLIPRKGSLDKLYYVDKEFWNVDTIFYTEINETLAVPKYVYYCLQKEHLEKLNKAGGVPSLTQTILNRVNIPLPLLEEQQRIVDILDKFNAYCNDLTKGLPAEIEARQKQYEYYREKLLTFKVKEN